MLQMADAEDGKIGRKEFKRLMRRTLQAGGREGWGGRRETREETRDERH